MEATEKTLVTISLTSEEYDALKAATKATDDVQLSSAIKEAVQKICRGGYTPDSDLALPKAC